MNSPPPSPSPSLSQIDQPDSVGWDEFGLDGEARFSRSLACSQTSLAAQNKPRFIPLRNRAFSSLSTSLASRKSARCNKCTRSIPSLYSGGRRQERVGGGEGGTGRREGASPLGPAHLAYSHPTPITPRPPSSLGIRINTTTLSPLPSCKPLSQRLRWGVSSNNAGNLPPSLSYAACNARARLLYGHWDLLGPMG